MQYHQSESHHKELAACTDEQLCAMAAAGDREAEELLVTRYYGMVRACARPLFLAGGDGEDLIQEGMFGLIQAIREYDADKAASFHTYAEICIRNRLFSALRAASRGKHYPLNESISLDTPSFDSSSYTAGTLDPSHTDPELLIAERDHVESLLESTRKHLSEFEAKILGYYLEGLSCHEIAKPWASLRSRWTTPCSAFAARLRSTFFPAISANAERIYFFLIQREGKIMYEDKTLVCKECGKEFVFTAGEQEFYAERGFQNEPQRCKACRDARKNAARGPREYFTAVCAACGGEAKVPFEPKSDRPVYCSECFAKMRAEQ